LRAKQLRKTDDLRARRGSLLDERNGSIQILIGIGGRPHLNESDAEFRSG
jgi:hypothetical protein